jgi:endo-alpha-1,4-polygalactosaminidase (GH114 family)
MKNLLVVLALILSVNVFGQVSKDESPFDKRKLNGQISKLEIFDVSVVSLVFQKADKLADYYESNKVNAEEFLGFTKVGTIVYTFDYVYSKTKEYSYVRIANTKDKSVILIFRYSGMSSFSGNLLTSKK